MLHHEFNLKSIDGLNLYFQSWEVENTPKGVVCLIHGLGEHSGRYAHWAELLNGAGYSVITCDLRGHGKSGGQRGHVMTFIDYMNDIDVLLNEARSRFSGVPYFLYGHSLGALVAMQYVLLRKPKVRGVVLTALSNNTSLQNQKVKVFISRLLGAIVPRLSINTGLVPSTLSRDSEIVRRYVEDPLVHHKVSVGWGKGALDLIDWLDQHVKEWTLPVLFMHGELDQLGYAKGSMDMASRVKANCTLKIWPGMYHEIHNELQKEIVFDFLRNWLDEQSVE